VGLHHTPSILDKFWAAKFKANPPFEAMECSIPSEFAPFMISLTDFEISRQIARGSFSELYLGLKLSTGHSICPIREAPGGAPDFPASLRARKSNLLIRSWGTSSMGGERLCRISADIQIHSVWVCVGGATAAVALHTLPTDSKSSDFLPNSKDTWQQVELFQAVELITALKCENLPLKIDECLLLSIAALISSNRGLLRCFLDKQMFSSIRFMKRSLVDSLAQILFPTFLQANLPLRHTCSTPSS
jgi:hypothetical protein